MKNLLFTLCLVFCFTLVSAMPKNEYFENGRIKREVVKVEHNLYKVTLFYENGKINETEFYKANGARTGTWLNYDDCGNLKYEANFKNDKKDGLWKVYEDNKISMILDYHNGKRVNCYYWCPEKGLIAKNN